MRAARMARMTTAAAPMDIPAMAPGERSELEESGEGVDADEEVDVPEDVDVVVGDYPRQGMLMKGKEGVFAEC